jgi:hypothetical protein
MRLYSNCDLKLTEAIELECLEENVFDSRVRTIFPNFQVRLFQTPGLQILGLRCHLNKACLALLDCQMRYCQS